jgi:hypothetical protein
MKKFEDGPSILGEWVYSTPIFWALPLQLGGWNLPFLMELEDLTFFQNSFLLKLEYTRTFIQALEFLSNEKVNSLKIL